jgi:hypothetical protein
LPRKRQPRDIPSDEEILAMEISEDRRLRESGIDPNGDPLDIMREVRLRVEKMLEEERLEEEAEAQARTVIPRSD